MENAIFKKATKEGARLRMAVSGPSGSGKTYTALAVGTHLAGRVALVDTEHGSASKYADLFDFDTVSMGAPYHPDRFCKIIEAAADEGYDVLIIDSLSHAWKGTGGLLQIVDKIGARQRGGGNFSAWKDATPIQERLVETMLSTDLHLIVTLRAKQEYAMEKDDKGKTTVRKLGMAPIQRDGVEYEFDLFCSMDMDHRLIVDKTRFPELTDAVMEKPGKDLADVLAAHLTSGKTPPVPEDTSAPDSLFPSEDSEPAQPKEPMTKGEASEALYAGDGAPAEKRGYEWYANQLSKIDERLAAADDEDVDELAGKIAKHVSGWPKAHKERAIEAVWGRREKAGDDLPTVDDALGRATEAKANGGAA